MKKDNKKQLFKKLAINIGLSSCFLGVSSIVFAQATNPFGSDGGNKSNVGINYNEGINNMNGNVQVNQQAIPSMPPAGLPPIQETVTRSSSSEQTEVDSVMTFINTPNERIRELNRELYKKGKVLNEGPVATPKSNNGMVVAHLSPGSVSPVVRLFKNRTSTIIITDMSGQPWPILNYDGLSTDDFSVKRLDNPAPNGYVLSVTPKGAFVSGNLVLILKGLPTPLNIEFVSAQKEVDVTTEVRVQAKGPNSNFSTIGLPSSIDTALLSVLQGVAPNGAKELKVSTGAAQAWLTKDGSMYVRTRYKVMSPAFDNVTSSPDGTYAYKMVPVPVVLFKVADGRFGEFTISGY